MTHLGYIYSIVILKVSIIFTIDEIIVSIKVIIIRLCTSFACTLFRLKHFKYFMHLIQ